MSVLEKTYTVVHVEVSDEVSKEDEACVEHPRLSAFLKRLGE